MPKHDYCCVPGCRARRNNGVLRAFHRFPLKGELKEKWHSAIRRHEGATFTVTKHTVVCSDHFRDADYSGLIPPRTAKERAEAAGQRHSYRLLRDAVPHLSRKDIEKISPRAARLFTPRHGATAAAAAAAAAAVSPQAKQTGLGKVSPTGGKLPAQQGPCPGSITQPSVSSTSSTPQFPNSVTLPMAGMPKLAFSVIPGDHVLYAAFTPMDEETKKLIQSLSTGLGDAKQKTIVPPELPKSTTSRDSVALTKKVPEQAIPERSSQFQNSQLLHERRLYGIVPVDGRTGEPVPEEQLAFPGAPPPVSLRSLLSSGPAKPGVPASGSSQPGGKSSAVKSAGSSTAKTAQGTLVNGVRGTHQVVPVPAIALASMLGGNASLPAAVTVPAGANKQQPAVPGMAAAAARAATAAVSTEMRPDPTSVNAIASSILAAVSSGTRPDSVTGFMDRDAEQSAAIASSILSKLLARPVDEESSDVSGEESPAESSPSLEEAAPLANQSNPPVTIKREKEDMNLPQSHVTSSVEQGTDLPSVSDRDIRLQEERIRQLKKMLAEAESSAKSTG